MVTLSKHWYLPWKSHILHISSINFSWKFWLILVLFFTLVLDIIFISFWLILGPQNDSKSDLKPVKTHTSGLRCPQEAPRPPQGCPKWPSGLHFRAFWTYQEIPRSPKGAQGAPQGSISDVLEVPWPPLCTIGTTFGALLPLMELVLSIWGNFWYLLGSSSPQKRHNP